MKKYDTIVIGAGISGCTSALILAMNGHKVALVESNRSLMPLIRRFRRKGFWCDPGFHYTGGLHDDGKMSVFMRYLGMDSLIQPVMMDPECFDIIRFKDHDYRIPWGMDRVREYLCGEFPKSRDAINTYLDYFHNLNVRTAFTNFDLPYGAYPEDLIESRSLYHYLRDHGAERKLIQLLGVHGNIIYGADVMVIPMYTNAYIMWSFYNGTGNFVNGGDALVNALTKRLKEAGVDIMLDSPVTRIDIDSSRRVRGVEIGGEIMLETTHCIATPHPYLLLNLLPGNGVRPAFRKRIRDMENTVSFAAVFYGTDFVPSPIDRMNDYIYMPERKGSLEGIFAIMKTVPDGQHALPVIFPMSQSELDRLFDIDRKAEPEKYKSIKREIAERADRALYSRYPELRGHAEVLDVATPATYQRYTGTPRGTAYGLKQSNQSYTLATRTPVQGLYLAGQSLNPGILGSMVTSFMAAASIVDPEQIWKEIRKCR